jgi:hypothetical protein
MTPSGIEPAISRFVAQYLNHCATISGPQRKRLDIRKMTGVMEEHHKGTGAKDRSIKDLGSDASNKFYKLVDVWKCVDTLSPFVREKATRISIESQKLRITSV